MNFIDTTIKNIDSLQKRHKSLSFIYAVIRKYGDDEAGYQVALITYYGFLSLFPLLIVTTSLLQLTLHGNSGFRSKIIGSLTNYFPIIGSQLQGDIHSLRRSGLGLILGILIILYGSRGVADAIRHALNQLWQVPRNKWLGFPKSAVNSLSIIVIGGIGMLLAGILSSFAAGLGHSFIIRIISSLVSMTVILVVILAIFKVGLATDKISKKALLISASTATIGIQILQSLGGYIVTHELKNLSSLYGTFALVLGILFWIYLQTQVVIYSVEVGIVYEMKLWPRSIKNESGA